jgi:GTP-binding protein
MEIHSADFVASYPKASQCPQDGLLEFAFIGRSNVGKSSLINMLTAKKGLAKTSQTPGKTQLLNYFLINKKWHLVDLPGYGYAKVSKTHQKKLSELIETYFQQRTSLSLAFVLIDSNINPPSKIDIRFINGLGELAVPFALVFTKSDKLGKVSVQKNVDAFLAELSKTWETLPPYFISSATYRTGREEVLSFIEDVIRKS